MVIAKSQADTTRKWYDYSVVTSPYDGSKFLRQYVERFSTVSFFNEYAGLLSYYYILAASLAPYVRIPIHGAFIDCRLHVFWIQSARSGKSIAYEFMAKILKLVGIDTEKFSAGSDAKMIGTTQEIKVTDPKTGKPTGAVEYEIVPGLLNGYKTLLFDEASILLNDKKAYFSDKILFLQQAMAPIGSETNVLVNHLKGASVHTPSGVSLWATTYPPKDIMTHVLDKGFFQRVYLFQNDITTETRQTTSEHRVSGAYKPVPERMWSYENIADEIKGIRDEVKGRLLGAAGLTSEEYEALSDEEKETLAQVHAYEIFNPGPNYHVALLSAVDDYYSLVYGIQDDNIRETAIGFLPNIENYTMIFGNLIAATMRSTVVTSEHIQMASEMIYDNLHNLIIWLEQKQDLKVGKKRQADIRAWREAYGKCKRIVHERTQREVVRKSDLEKAYSTINGVSTKTARRRLDDMMKAKLAVRVAEGKNAFISLEL
tara:strand:+ start:3938 stop:5392 length:1455 start_codon:yes stop_codon:yes gene_type:complete